MNKNQWEQWPKDVLGQIIIKDAADVQRLTDLTATDSTVRRRLERALAKLDAQVQAVQNSTIVKIDFAIKIATRAQVLREILTAAQNPRTERGGKYVTR